MLADWLAMHITLLLVRFESRLGRSGISQHGQSMVEYSIIAALVAIVALAAVTALGNDIKGVFLRIAGSVGNLGGSGAGG